MRDERSGFWLRGLAWLRTCAWLGLGASVLIACGSGSGAGGDAGIGTSTTGNITWKDDGVVHKSLISSAAMVKSAQMDLLQIAGGEANGVAALSFGIGAKPTLVPGSFTCAATGMYPIVSFVYTAPGTGTLVDSCAIEITTIGAKTGDRTTGTFSTTVPLTAGGKKLVTEGKFDLPTTVSSLN